MNKTGIIIAAAAACVAAAGAIVFCMRGSSGYSGTVTAQEQMLIKYSHVSKTPPARSGSFCYFFFEKSPMILSSPSFLPPFSPSVRL